MTFLLDLGVERGDGEPRFAIEDGGFDLKRIVAQFCFSRARQIKVGDESFQFCRGESIRLSSRIVTRRNASAKSWPVTAWRFVASGLPNRRKKVFSLRVGAALCRDTATD